MNNLINLPEWQALISHQCDMQNQHMRTLFSQNPARSAQFSLQKSGIFFDFSRNRITQETLLLLEKLAHAVQLSEKITALFAGKPINISEKRSVLHTALRDQNLKSLMIQGKNIATSIAETKEKMRQFVAAIHSKNWRGVTGKPIQHIVNVGIGGSYQGPLLCVHALKDFAVSDLHFHFISSVDKAQLEDVLQEIDPETTLFILSSKSFNTIETLTNAKTLRAFMQDKLGKKAISQHFIAITAAQHKAQDFGILTENIFPLWEWVGGRYSIWSAIGLPLMLMIGDQHFNDFLAGAYEMDQHFQSAPFLENMPVLLALLDIWYTNFFGSQVKAIAAYAHRLRYLIPYLQQAEMESNGKAVNQQGESLPYMTSPVIFGDEGCHGQHAYHQLLHQGQQLIPVDFILIGKNTQQRDPHQDILLASGLSQAHALMQGKTYAEAYQELIAAQYLAEEASGLAHHRAIPGNRPSNILYLDALNPKNLGALLALYEHRIFVQGAIWDINSFDQWGVELGKQLLPEIQAAIQNESSLTRFLHTIHEKKG